MGRSIPWTATATEYDANREFCKNIDLGPVYIEQHNRSTLIPEGTSFSLVYVMKFCGCMRMLSPLLVHSLRKEMQNSLIKMKEILEK
jgi:hypothetical protein